MENVTFPVVQIDEFYFWPYYTFITPLYFFLLMTHHEQKQLNLTVALTLTLRGYKSAIAPCFYMYHPIKASLFQKIIFELVHLFHIVLESLVSY